MSTEKEYLDCLKQYYNEKLQYQLKPNQKNCRECGKEKKFTETKEKLIYSCGTGCKRKIEIKKERYDELSYYPRLKEAIHYEINSPLSKEKISFLYSPEEIKRDKEILKDRLKLYKESTDIFKAVNDIKKKKKSIVSTHENRMKMKQEQILLRYKINKENDLDKKKEYKLEYIENNRIIKESYNELRDLFINEELMIKRENGKCIRN